MLHGIKNSDGKYKVPLNCVDSTSNECITLSCGDSYLHVCRTRNQTEICRKTHPQRQAHSRVVKKLNVPCVQESGTATVGCFIDADLIKWL